MKILALDTATELCSVALLVGDQLIYRELETSRGAADHLLPMVDEVLAEASLPLGALDVIAFGRGPGGFTGVRLAASVTQGLAFGAGLPVAAVSDLSAVALRALDLDSAAKRVLVCNDARMQQVYWACFERKEARPVLVEEEHVGMPGEVILPTVATHIGGGRGFKAYPELRERVSVAYDELLPRASEIATLSVDAPRLAPEEAVPVYVRDEVATPKS